MSIVVDLSGIVHACVWQVSVFAYNFDVMLYGCVWPLCVFHFCCYYVWLCLTIWFNVFYEIVVGPLLLW